MGPESEFVSNFSLIFSAHWKLRKKVGPLKKLVGNTADFVDNECTMYPNYEKNHFSKKASTLNNLDLYWVADLRKKFLFFSKGHPWPWICLLSSYLRFLCWKSY